MLPLTRALVVTSFIEEAVVVGSQESTTSTMDDGQYKFSSSDNEQHQQITHEKGDSTSSIVAMVSRIHGGSIAVCQWMLSCSLLL
jgi:hypothetical protein